MNNVRTFEEMLIGNEEEHRWLLQDDDLENYDTMPKIYVD